MGYNTKFYIAVSGDEDSTFKLEAYLSNENFVVLESDITEVSSIVGSQIDSYIYTFVARQSKEFEDNFRQFYVGVQVVSEDV